MVCRSVRHDFLRPVKCVLVYRGKFLVQWYTDLENYATEALKQGKAIPGWKLVEGRSNRTFTNQEEAIKAVIAAG